MTDPSRPAGTGLDLHAVTITYGANAALRDVSMSIAPGEVVGLAGPNGSGKSTLLRAAAGLTRIAGGRVAVDGVEIALARPSERARRIAWMPQEEPVGDNVPLRDYVEYGRYAWTDRWLPSSSHDRSVVDRALTETDLLGLLERGVAELSGGERQRARLARVLAQDAPFLLLDEPTAHLDIGHQLEVLDRVRAFAHREHRGVLVALHDLNLAARFTDRIAVLSRGQLVASGAPADVLSPGLLGEVWGIAAEVRRDPASGLPYLLPRLFERPTPPPSPSGPRRVHVVAGGGSGARLLRALADHGYATSAGVLPLFDTDTELARELAVPTAVELPFAPIGEEALQQMDGLIEAADAVVVAPFPVGPSNLANLERLLTWVGRRPMFLLDQPPEARWDYVDGRATALRTELLRRGADRGTESAAALAWLATLPSATGRPGAGSGTDR